MVFRNFYCGKYIAQEMEKETIPKIKGDNDKSTQNGIRDYFDDPLVETEEYLLAQNMAERIFNSEIEDREKIMRLADTFYDKSVSLFKKGEASEVLKIGQECLKKFAEIKGIEKLNMEKREDCVLLTEAINWSAKAVDDNFYFLKPVMIVASALKGVPIGMETMDNGWDIYYLFDRNTGVASFHDPRCEVWKLFNEVDESIRVELWEFGWSGVSRVWLENNFIPEKERLFMQKMRYQTLPGQSAKEKRELSDYIEETYSIV